MILENFLWNYSYQEISKHFEIVDAFNATDQDVASDERLALFFNKHKNRAFKNNEKLFIVCSDAQYYLPGSKFGISLYNVFQELRDSMIESSNIIFSVNRPGYAEELAWLNQYYNLNTLIFLHNCDDVNCLEDVKKVDLNIDKIEYSAGFTNGAQRFHRMLFLCLFENQNILEKTVYSHNFNQAQRDMVLKTATDFDETKSAKNPYERNIKTTLPHIICVEPHSQLNDNIILNKKYTNIYNKHKDKFMNVTYRHECISALTTADGAWYAEYYQKCFVQLVTETVFDYPTPFVSEKTFKCIANKRPFVIIGSANSLKYLRSLGFKTFEGFWDESYDAEDDVNKRISKILSVTEYLVNLNSNERRTIIKEMKDILDYNHDNYISLLKENFSTSLKGLLEDDKKIKAALARK